MEPFEKAFGVAMARCFSGEKSPDSVETSYWETARRSARPRDQSAPTWPASPLFIQVAEAATLVRRGRPGR